jgi:hypothetical protein
MKQGVKNYIDSQLQKQAKNLLSLKNRYCQDYPSTDTYAKAMTNPRGLGINQDFIVIDIILPFY